MRNSKIVGSLLPKETPPWWPGTGYGSGMLSAGDSGDFLLAQRWLHACPHGSATGRGNVWTFLWLHLIMYHILLQDVKIYLHHCIGTEGLIYDWR